MYEHQECCFGEAVYKNGPNFEKDGILEMAWLDIAEPGITVVFQQMIDQGVILSEQVRMVIIILLLVIVKRIDRRVSPH